MSMSECNVLFMIPRFGYFVISLLTFEHIFRNVRRFDPSTKTECWACTGVM